MLETHTHAQTAWHKLRQLSKQRNIIAHLFVDPVHGCGMVSIPNDEFGNRGESPRESIMKIHCTKLGEDFDVPFETYSPEAKANAISVGLHRILNDAMAGVVRKDFPTGVAGDESYRDVGRRKVRVRLANLANADRPTTQTPVEKLVELAKSDPKLMAELKALITAKAA